MLQYRSGNLLDASAEALVNTVNEVGVMGKGIALMFKERFPESSRAYTEASKAGEVRVGRMFVTETNELFPRWIIHFPTKKHWRNPSKLAWVKDGLEDLVRVIREYRITSVALPPLGCGNGGLLWSDVRPVIEQALADLQDVNVIVYEPTATYQNVRKTIGMEKLTPARALVVEMVRRYAVLGIECTLLEVHKLAYFMQQSVLRLQLADPLDLRFVANRYGPYAERLRHLLDALDGSYLHSDKRVADARPFDTIWFEESKRNYVETYLRSEAQEYIPALEDTARLIDGFESPLGLEALATVHWLVTHGGSEATLDSIKRRLTSWPGGQGSAQRKLQLFNDDLLMLALERITVAQARVG
jgi:O-acetyl-ADP-ribose deacetylase (regulator of RNase III)